MILLNACLRCRGACTVERDRLLEATCINCGASYEARRVDGQLVLSPPQPLPYVAERPRLGPNTRAASGWLP